MNILRPIMAGLLITTASTAYAAQVTVSKVEVDAEMSDVNNKAALEYYPNIKQDLETAISEELFPLTGEDGYTVKVRITEISLDGQPLKADKGFNTLDGWVFVYPPAADQSDQDDGAAEATPQQEFNIQLNATAMGEGIMPGTEDYYRAMIATFAQSTGEKVKDMDAAVE
ncbi:MAG: hypothetical protein WBN04_15165 [Paracoccaceae bacterium]